jgi:nucleotide-binding universal stress UspA family protein
MSQDNITEQAQQIVACIDGSSTSQAVCDYSSWVAQKADMPLTLLHTIEHPLNTAMVDMTGSIGLGSQQELLNELTELDQSRSKLLVKKGQHLLKATKERALSMGVKDVSRSQIHGSLTESLIDIEDNTGLIVLGIRGEDHESEQQGLGHQLETVIRSLHKPIMVVNAEFKTPKNIMLAYDGSECCQKALTMIAESELCHDLPCHIVHVGSQKDELLAKAKAELTQAGIEVVTAQISGKPEQALAQYQTEHKIDIMLMGAFSHNRVRDFLLGSFTEKMLAATHKPLLLLR